METIATSKGQIVIPSKVRKQLGIEEGTRIQITVDDNEKIIILKPITRQYIHSLRNRLKGKDLLNTLKTMHGEE